MSKLNVNYINIYIYIIIYIKYKLRVWDGSEILFWLAPTKIAIVHLKVLEYREQKNYQEIQSINIYKLIKIYTKIK